MTTLPIAMPPLATDQRTVAERKWQSPTVADKPQRPCDHGLFSDEHRQLELPLK